MRGYILLMYLLLNLESWAVYSSVRNSFSTSSSLFLTVSNASFVLLVFKNDTDDSRLRLMILGSWLCFQVLFLTDSACHLAVWGSFCF